MYCVCTRINGNNMEMTMKPSRALNVQSLEIIFTCCAKKKKKILPNNQISFNNFLFMYSICSYVNIFHLFMTCNLLLGDEEQPINCYLKKCFGVTRLHLDFGLVDFIHFQNQFFPICQVVSRSKYNICNPKFLFFSQHWEQLAHSQ